jgi:excisionase family DNA binding protein
MKVKQAAAVLEVSTGTVYALVASGRLGCCRIGVGRGAIRISDEQLADYRRSTQTVAVNQVSISRPQLKHLRLS